MGAGRIPRLHSPSFGISTRASGLRSPCAVMYGMIREERGGGVGPGVAGFRAERSGRVVLSSGRAPKLIERGMSGVARVGNPRLGELGYRTKAGKVALAAMADQPNGPSPWLLPPVCNDQTRDISRV